MIFRKSEVTRTGMFTTKEGVGDVLPLASVQVVIIIVLYFFYTFLFFFCTLCNTFTVSLPVMKSGQCVFIS